MRAALVALCLLACAPPAKASLYHITATYNSSNPGSVTGTFTMDNRDPATISNVDIDILLPAITGPYSFNFDGVIYATQTSPVGYLWFVDDASYAGSTYFWMGFKYNASLNDGSYLIGMWGNPGNPHPSEISVAEVNNWQGITGIVTLAPVPGPIVGAGILGLVMAFGGLLAWRRRRNQAAAGRGDLCNR